MNLDLTDKELAVYRFSDFIHEVKEVKNFSLQGFDADDRTDGATSASASPTAPQRGSASPRPVSGAPTSASRSPKAHSRSIASVASGADSRRSERLMKA